MLMQALAQQDLDQIEYRVDIQKDILVIQDFKETKHSRSIYDIYHISGGFTLRATCRVGSSVKANVEKWLDRLIIAL